MVLVFAAALAALPPSDGTSWIELAASAQLDVGTLHKDPSLAVPLTTTNFTGGGASAAVTAFGHRILDDDAAPSLQPFLQRTAQLHLEGGGGGATIEYPAYVLSSQEPATFLQTYKASESSGHVTAQADGYLRRWLWGAVHVGVDYAAWAPLPQGQSIGGFGNVTPVSPGVVAPFTNSELTLTTSAAAGVRWRDLRLSAGWSVRAFRFGADALQVRFWGGAFAGVHAVVRRFVALDARVDVLDGGAAGQGDVTVWLRRRFGLSAGVEGGYGALVDSPTVFSRAGGHVGFAAWLTPRLSMSLAYAAVWQHALPAAGLGTEEPDWSYVAHTITLSASVRPR